MTAAVATASSWPSKWEAIGCRAPQLAATMLHYLDQLASSVRPTTLRAADEALRGFATFAVDYDPKLRRLKSVNRGHVEAYKLWLGERRTRSGGRLANATLRQRLGMLRVFFERVIEWAWDDAPARCPVFEADLPKADEPLPKFLDDPSAARFMQATGRQDPLCRVVVELLARTGMRVGELCALGADAVVRVGDAHWLRIPVGKLHNDRYIPLHPHLVDLLDAWRTQTGPDDSGLLLTNHGRPLNRHAVARMVRRVARDAGIGHVHPHRLRHTLATQAINRGMSLEAIAALLGHRSMRMTLVYARIADRTLAEEYYTVTEQVEALYTHPPTLPATAEGTRMRQLRVEAHRRLLGNGYCARPPELDCVFESICETCTHYRTALEFRPVLIRQRDHAAEHNQPHRAELFDNLIAGLDDRPQ